jgi:ATP-dependent RNA helicase DeaD
MNFQDMNLKEHIFQGLEQMEILTPTPIQQQTIPQALDNPKSHIMAQARTGSGKTLAFAIPIVQNLDTNLKKVQVIILVPTRELCKQVAEVFVSLTQFSKLNIVQVYGGVSIERQIRAIQDGAQIVVATPGRLIDLYNRNRINFREVKFVVLDEADRMLDMGFMPDIEFLMLQAMKNISPRMMLFSATMLEQVKSLAKRFTRGKNIIEIDVSKDSLTVSNCNQYYYEFDDKRDKYYHFVRILRKERPKHCMIFVNTKRTGDWLFGRLIDEKNLNLKPELISGNLTQRKREVVLEKFRKRKINCLIATDVAARGLDIERVSHVFNYDLPEFEENYVHRIGRTARVTGTAGKVEKGIAISLVQTDQYRTLARIEGFMNKEIQKRPLPKRQRNGNWNKRSEKQEPEKQGYRRGDQKSQPRRSSNNPNKSRSNRRNFLY